MNFHLNTIWFKTPVWDDSHPPLTSDGVDTHENPGFSRSLWKYGNRIRGSLCMGYLVYTIYYRTGLDAYDKHSSQLLVQEQQRHGFIDAKSLDNQRCQSFYKVITKLDSYGHQGLEPPTLLFLKNPQLSLDPVLAHSINLGCNWKVEHCRSEYWDINDWWPC